MIAEEFSEGQTCPEISKSPKNIRGHKGQISIRGHKGQNSTGTRFRGFLVMESRCRGFLVLESRCRGFLSSEKMSWNYDVVVF